MENTSNYNLKQWEETERIMMQDFNADNAKIDAALAAAAAGSIQMAAGEYTGDGAARRTITLGFTPRMVFLFPTNGTFYYDSGTARTTMGGIAYTDHPVYAYNNAAVPVVAVAEGGFTVYKSSYTASGNTYRAESNSNDSRFRYFAIG